MLYIVCMMCRHFLKMGHLNVHIVTHTEESRWSSCSYSVISHQPYLSSKIDTGIIRMEVNLDPFLVGFYECSDIFGCQVLSTITKKNPSDFIHKIHSIKQGLVRCCLQNRVTNDSTKQVSFDVVFLKLFELLIIKLSGNTSDFFGHRN